MGGIVLGNARLVGGGAEPVDLVVEAGRISAIALAGRGDGDQVELDGRYVQAGLWDHHVHFTQYALARSRIDLSRVESAAEAARVVGRAVSERQPAAGTRVAGFGFRDGLWPDQPHKALLDSVVPGLPVALAGGDLHCVWLNSAGLAVIGAAGHPTGVLREDAVFPVLREFQALPGEEVDALVLAAAADLAARGVVGIVELETQRNPEVWGRRAESGRLPLRVECGVYAEDLEWAIGRGLRTGDALTASPLLRMGPLKVLTDGSLNTRTAYCDHAYPGIDESSAEQHGLLVVPREDLVRLIRRASEHGIVPAIHAIGDRANSLVLDASAEVGCRGRIEHAQLLRNEDFERFALLGVDASVQPYHAVDDRDVAEVHWAGRTGRAYAYGDLWRAGARLRFGSDAPVAPPDPWLTIQAAVARTVDEREPWHPEQRLPVEAALAASTPHGALPRVGEPADLVVLERDPLAVPVNELGAMPVHATMTAGEWTTS
ncbi:amidohydrolase [Flindersiella endophytica]